MDITAEFIDTDFTPVTLTCTKDTLVSDLLLLIHETHDLNPDLLEVTYTGDPLKSSDNICALGIREGCVLGVGLSKKELAKKYLKQMGKTASVKDMLNDIWRQCSCEIVQLYLDAGIDVNAADPRLGTPLRYAALCGRSDVVNLLLAQSTVNPNFSTPSCCPALIEAATGDHLFICKQLAAHPATDINITWKETSPIVASVERGHLDCVKMFTSLPNCKLDSKDILLEATKRGLAEIVKYLLSIPSIRDHASSRSLMSAAVLGYHQIAEALIPFVDVNELNDCGPSERKTALHCAIQYGSLDVVSLLVNCPSLDFTVKDHNNDTALEFATNSNKTEAAKIISDALATRGHA